MRRYLSIYCSIFAYFYNGVIILSEHIITLSTVILQEDMKYNDVNILTYKIEYPQFKSLCYQLALTKVNRFYQNKALEYQNYCRTELFKMAVKQYKYDIANDIPIRCFEAMVSFNLTYKSGSLLSMYFDKYEYTGGSHGNTIRTSQTWNLQACSKVRLKQLFNYSFNYKEYILKQVKKQIENEKEYYFDDYEKLIEQTFNENNFYCTKEGVVIYYQQYDIAPYSSGVREFLIPYSNQVNEPNEIWFYM